MQKLLRHIVRYIELFIGPYVAARTELGYHSDFTDQDTNCMIQATNSSMGKRFVSYSKRADLIWDKPRLTFDESRK
jgi:hypothetical protein